MVERFDQARCSSRHRVICLLARGEHVGSLVLFSLVTKQVDADRIPPYVALGGKGWLVGRLVWLVMTSVLSGAAGKKSGRLLRAKTIDRSRGARSGA